MPTQLQMVNMALNELGKPTVSNINDSPAAQQVAAFLTQCYPEVLLECNWNWGVKYVQDSSPLTENYSPDFMYTYLMPSDWGQFFKWSQGTWPVYEFVDTFILANQTPIQYYYIVNNAPFALVPPLAARAIALYVASKAAPTLVNNAVFTKYLKDEYKIAKINAILQNDQQRLITSGPYNDFDRITFV